MRDALSVVLYRVKISTRLEMEQTAADLRERCLPLTEELGTNSERAFAQTERR
jgi:hypothetical protein